MAVVAQGAEILQHELGTLCDGFKQNGFNANWRMGDRGP